MPFDAMLSSRQCNALPSSHVSDSQLDSSEKRIFVDPSSSVINLRVSSCK